MQRLLIAIQAVALTLALASTSALAQGATTRVVVFPFDASRSVDALGLATASAVQRAINQVDGLYAPPVGDALGVVQRANQSGVDPIAAAQRLFQADAIVLGRIVGTSQLEVELVVVIGSEDRTETVRGSVAELSTLWRSITERALAQAGVTLAPADLAQLRGALGSAPSLPSLGPLGFASARLPGLRLDDLRTALELDPDSAWLRSEAARAALLDGDAALALELAAGAAADAPEVAEIRVVEGVVRSATGDTVEAGAAFRAALEVNPNHALALAGLAAVSDAPAERIALLERALAAAPRLVDAHLNFASLQTDPQRRLQALRRAAERVPDSLTVQRALVDEVLAAGDPRGALALLQQTVADPIGRAPATYALAASLPDAVGAEALAFVQEGRGRFPDSVVLAIAEADLQVAAGDLGRAEAVLRDVIAADPGNLVAVEALATVLGRAGKLDEAEALLTQAIDDEALRTLRVVELQLASGRARSALATLAPMIEAGERDPLLRTYYGIALGRIGRVGEGRAVLEEVLAEAPDLGVAARGLSALEQQSRIVGDDEALALEGEAAVAFEQGLAALETGEWAMAAASFASARAFEEAGLLAFYEGYARQRGGDSRGAIAAYRDARERLGDNDILLSNLGFAHLQLGRLDLALEVLQAAVASNPQNAQAHFNLGLAEFGVARFVAALASFERAVELAPELAQTAEPWLAEARRRSQ